MKKLKQLNKQQGFTIIEVMIVLAIAALILLVVFLAVPSLQRSQRNNARQTDSARVSAAVVDFTSSNGGLLPGLTSSPTNDCSTIINGSTTLAQYTFQSTPCAAGDILSGAAWPSFATANHFWIETSLPAAALTAPTANGIMILIDSATCSGTTPTTTGATPGKSAALLYSLELGSSGYTWGCRSPQ